MMATRLILKIGQMNRENLGFDAVFFTKKFANNGDEIIGTFQTEYPARTQRSFWVL